MTNEEMVNALVESGVLKTPSIIDAFKKIDRADFVIADYKEHSYEDAPLPIGYNQTISQPTTVAFMLELLEIEKGNTVLDIGSGSGWTAALISSIVETEGKVIASEIIPELVALGQENLKKYNFSQTEIRQSDKDYGIKDESGFDRILVSAAADQVPEVLKSKLSIGGILVLPVQNALVKLQKQADQTFVTEEFPGFAFVELK